MIQAFVEKNRKLLEWLCRIARIGGWLLLGSAFLAVAGKSVALISRIGDWQEFMRFYNSDVPWGMFREFIPTGLMALGVAQFFKYLLEETSKPGWVLRNADKLLYLYAGILFAFFVWAGLADIIFQFRNRGHYDWIITVATYLVLVCIKMLALIGLAQILKRLLPMMEESRTLV
jgi:hypothetical protein